MPDDEILSFEDLVCSALKEFTAVYPSDEHCLEALFQLLFPNGEMNCKHCGGVTEKRGFGARFALCLSCRRTSWVTADTPFHGVRKLQARLASIWLMERGIPINSTRIQKALNIPLSTAWAIFHATTKIIAQKMLGQFPLIQADSFSSIIFRRCRESPASIHPREELDIETCGGQSDLNCEPTKKEHSLDEAEHADTNTQSARSENENDSWSTEKEIMTSNANCEPSADCEASSRNQELVISVLKAGQANFDKLCSDTGLNSQELSVTLTLLEFAGLVTRKCGDIYSLQKRKSAAAGDLPVELKEGMKKAKALLKTCFQGVSWKYLQNYLAFVWLQLDRSEWKQGNLLKTICLTFKPHFRELSSGAAERLVAVFPTV